MHRRRAAAALGVAAAAALFAFGAQSADASPVTTSKTYSAWSVFHSRDELGSVYAPCSRGDRWGDTNGAELTSTGGEDILTVAASLPLPGAAVRWRLRFVKVDTDPDFAWYSSTADAADSTTWAHATMFPSSRPKGTTMTTPWVDGTGRARFVIASVTNSVLDVQSVTLETSSVAGP